MTNTILFLNALLMLLLFVAFVYNIYKAVTIIKLFTLENRQIKEMFENTLMVLTSDKEPIYIIDEDVLDEDIAEDVEGVDD